MFDAMPLSAAEYIEVEKYANRMPLHERRADLRAAMLAFTQARAAGIKGIALDDVLIEWGPPKLDDDDAQTPEEMDRQMQKVVGMIEARERANGK
jgi:hypothetical protein